jgi:hypothetical protein
MIISNKNTAKVILLIISYVFSMDPSKSKAISMGLRKEE